MALKYPEKKEQAVRFASCTPKYSFSDLILAKETQEELQTVVAAHECWHTVFEKWGLNQVMRDKQNLLVNLYGESGTGKTMAAHAIADALHKEIVCINYAEIESKYVGETSKNLDALFHDPLVKTKVLFFDEADALLSKRVTDMTQATDVSVNQTRSQLLSLLNFYNGMVIFATNFISNYDPAFMRRIQYHIQFSLPTYELRCQLWKHYIPKSMPTDISIDVLANFDNMSGSDISTAVLKAALSAARKKQQIVKQEDFLSAIQGIQNSKNANGNSRTRVREIDASEVPEDIRQKVKTKENDYESD